MRRPLNDNPKITTRFKDHAFGSLGAHLGIDYGVPVGTFVFAPVSGTVAVVRETSGKGAGGKQIELHGSDGYWHRFLHLSAWKVHAGQKVNEGDLLGFTGATGDVTGPHLHWDMRKANTVWNASLKNYVDPEKRLADSVKSGSVSQANIGKTIYLSKTVPKWAFYKPGTPLPVNRVNRAGELAPKKWGGLSYKIVGNPAPNTYEVVSPSLGHIWLYADKDATIK